MSVAVLSDIHANLPALEAVLADVEREEVAALVVAGDTVSGPWPAEVFDRLRAHGALHARGNVDRLALEGGEGAIGAWSSSRLGRRRRDVAAWPLTVEVLVEGLGRVLVCHSTPTSDEPIYTRITPEQALGEILGPVDADVLVCGHTHVQYDRMLSTGLRIVNPGSVGLPYEGAQGAFWALLGPDVALRRSEYDVEAAAAAMRETGAPEVEEQLVRSLLDPPDAAAATAFFESQRAA
jgi:putative phosphoesterase